MRIIDRKYVFLVLILALFSLNLSCGGGEDGELVLTGGGTTSGAPGATLFLSPEDEWGNIGDTFSVDVRLDTGDRPVTAVSAYLSFPADLLEVDSIDTTYSDFGIEAENIVAGNVIKITRGEPTPGIYDLGALVATIDFTAKAQGTPQLYFQLSSGGGATSRVIQDDGLGTDILTTVIGGSYTIEP